VVVDSSALLAILCAESDAKQFADALAQSGVNTISAANVLEAHIVITSKYGEAAASDLDELLRAAQIDIVEVTAAQLLHARRAYDLFGKGRHVAALNFGDCFAYALAKERNEALLFKGRDFLNTDTVRAI